MQLILHVGDHKAGSSTIQAALARQAIRITDRTIFYPSDLSHNYLREEIVARAKGKEPRRRKGLPGLPEIAEMVRSADPDYIVLSGEAFEDVQPIIMRKALSTVMKEMLPTIRVISYIRPHAGRILSTYAEQVKIGRFDGSPEEFFDKVRGKNRFDFAPRLAAWRRIFGDRFIARPFVHSEFPEGNLLLDFAERAFPGEVVQVDETVTVNASLTVEDLALLRYVHRQLTSIAPGPSLGLGWEIAREAGLHPDISRGTKLRTHRSLAARIRDRYQADAKSLDVEVFGDSSFSNDLDRAFEAALDNAQSVEPEDHFSAVELRRLKILAETIGAMLSNQEVNWVEFFRGTRGTGKIEVPHRPPIVTVTKNR